MESELNVCYAYYMLCNLVNCAHYAHFQAAQDAVMVGTEMQAVARTIFKEQMMKRLAKKPWIADHSMTCLAPGSGLL